MSYGIKRLMEELDSRAYSFEEIEHIVEETTQGYTKVCGQLKTYFAEESNIASNLLKKHYNYVQIQDGREADDADPYYIIRYGNSFSDTGLVEGIFGNLAQKFANSSQNRIRRDLKRVSDQIQKDSWRTKYDGRARRFDVMSDREMYENNILNAIKQWLNTSLTNNSKNIYRYFLEHVDPEKDIELTYNSKYTIAVVRFKDNSKIKSRLDSWAKRGEKFVKGQVVKGCTLNGARKSPTEPSAIEFVFTIESSDSHEQVISRAENLLSRMITWLHGLQRKNVVYMSFLDDITRDDVTMNARQRSILFTIVPNQNNENLSRTAKQKDVYISGQVGVLGMLQACDKYREIDYSSVKTKIERDNRNIVSKLIIEFDFVK